MKSYKGYIRGSAISITLIGVLYLASSKPLTTNIDSLLVIRENIFNILVMQIVLVFDRILEAILKGD